MHYYRRNLGDYAKKTGRLSMLQHGAYTLLIDSCYDRERFPTLSDAIEWTWASTKEEIEAVEFVLRKFFVLHGEIYIQPRIIEELEKYHENSATNKRIAIEREAKRKEKSTNRVPTVNEPPPNHKPITTNQEPITTNQEPKTKSKKAAAVAASNFENEILAEFGIFGDLQSDFIKHRKSLKAPITITVISGYQREADKAGISIVEAVRTSIERGWRGFKAEWIASNTRNFSPKPDKLDSTIQAGIEWLKGE